MRDGQVMVRFDLLLEERNDRTVRAEHIAEADGCEGGIRGDGIDVLDDHFTDALGCPHNVGWVNRLVGGNENEAFRLVLARRHCRIQRAEDVVFDRLVGDGFHQGTCLCAAA